jgi:hypothetical protein
MVIALESRVLLSAKTATARASAGAAAVIRDDSFEDNDTRETANDFATLTAVTEITAAFYDYDWYKFKTTLRGQPGDFVRITFTESKGDLGLALYDAEGTELAVSNSDRSNTEELSLQGRAAGTYYVLAYAGNGVTNPSYKLMIDPPAPPVDDSYENNDTQATAHILGTLTAPRNISNLALLDADYFKFSTTQMGTEASFVSVGFDHDAGDVDLFLYDSNGLVVGFSATDTQNYERISMDGLPAGTYTVLVNAPYSPNPSYDLSIAPPNAKDGEHTHYLNFDGYNISRSELEEWENGEWLDDILSAFDEDNNGVRTSAFLVNRSERELVITQMLSMLTTDLSRFGIQVVRHFGPAVTNQEATTIFLGPSTVSTGAHIASDIDYQNINQTDIAFVGDEWWGSVRDTAIALADVTLHEAGHTFGLYHVVSGTKVETMGLRYNTPSTKWVKNTKFMDKSFQIKPDHGPAGVQNSHLYMWHTFVLGTHDSSVGQFELNPLAAVSEADRSSLVKNRNRVARPTQPQ